MSDSTLPLEFARLLKDVGDWDAEITVPSRERRPRHRGAASVGG